MEATEGQLLPDPVQIVRERLKALMEERGLTREEVAACVKKPSGERYSAFHITHFLLDDQENQTWRQLALAIICAFPEIGRGTPCPYCHRK